MADVALQHHTARVNDVMIHYVIAGQGEPVVLLHGWPQTWYEWRKIIPALAARYTVIAPDMRGIGDSSRPVSGYDKRTVADDIYQLVRKLGHEKIFLVGHDWGGPVAYAYAVAHPADVRKLVILDVGIPGKSTERAFPFRSGGVWHMQFHNVRDLPEALVAGRERIYLTWFYRTAYNPTAIGEEDIDEYVRCYSAPGAMRAGFEYYRAVFAMRNIIRMGRKTSSRCRCWRWAASAASARSQSGRWSSSRRMCAAGWSRNAGIGFPSSVPSTLVSSCWRSLRSREESLRPGVAS